MTLQYGAWLALTAVSTLFLALWLRTRRLLPKAIDQLRGLHDDKDQAQRDLVGKLQVELEAERRKSSEYFKTIDEACKQRDFWRRWYYRQASEHGHAQGYLLNRYELLALQYTKATGKKPALDPITKDLVEEFKDVHPVLADAGRDAQDETPAEPRAGDTGTPPAELDVDRGVV